MQQALKFLCDHKEIALATCEGNLPKLRLFQIMKQEGTHIEQDPRLTTLDNKTIAIVGVSFQLRFASICKYSATTNTNGISVCMKNATRSDEMTLELIQRMVDWDRRQRVLKDWKWKVMDNVVSGRKPLTDRMKYSFYLHLEKLKKNGFE